MNAPTAIGLGGNKDFKRNSAPDIVAAILHETFPAELTLFDLAVDPPASWEEQRGRIGVPLRQMWCRDYKTSYVPYDSPKIGSRRPPRAVRW